MFPDFQTIIKNNEKHNDILKSMNERGASRKFLPRHKILDSNFVLVMYLLYSTILAGQKDELG